MIPEITPDLLYNISPLLFLGALGSFNFILEVLLGEKGRILNGLVSIFGVLVCSILVLFLSINSSSQISEPFAFSLLFDSYSLFFTFIFLAGTVFCLLLEISHEDVRCGEVYGLTIFASLGMVLMASGLELMSIFLGLEVMSLSIYALAGVKRTDLLSNEAALKYFLMGAFASGIFLYGIALVYGATGSIYLSSIASFISSQTSTPLILLAGLIFLLVGFSFKVALVPFHMWTPDVYEGAPTSITTFMATAVKAAGFAAFVRVFLMAFSDLYVYWSSIFWVLAVLTMTLGNIVALVQTSVKRMLSYSSIAHAGYILLGFIACSKGHEKEAVSGMLYYLWTYTFMTAGAFAVVFCMEETTEEDDRKRYAGLGWRRPFLAAMMTIFLLSLAGIPPTAGFIAKFYVFSSSINQGFYWLTVIAVLNSLVSLYYYLKPLIWMYMVEGEAKAKPRLLPALVTLALILAALGTLYLGLFPNGSTTWALNAAGSLFPSSFIAGN